MAIAVEDIEQTLRAFVSAEIECEAIPDDPTQVGCVMPLQYPSGDYVTVWVEQPGSRFRLSDHGESFRDVIGRKRADVRAMEAVAEGLAARWGVEVKGGALVAQADYAGLGDTMWRLAAAAHRVGHDAAAFRPPRHHRQREEHFVREVEGTFRNQNLAVERDVRLPGQSGHTYTATLYIPAEDMVVEPIPANAQYNQISSVYLKFGDLSHANGYGRLALVDDRYASPSSELDGALRQVGRVVRWTRREQWIVPLFGSG
jgi:Domain of unknown function DUF1828